MVQAVSVVAVVAAAAALLWRVEPAGRRRLAAQGALFLGCVVGLDLVLRAVTPHSLWDRAQQVEAWLTWRAAPEDDFVADPCAQFAHRSFATTAFGERRDARGHLVFTVPGADPVRIGVIGDSVLYQMAARALFEGFRRAGEPAVIIDTSAPGYALADYACMVERLAAEGGELDLIVMGLVLNDAGREDVDLDLGHGLTRYSILSYANDNPAIDRLPPLFLPSAHPWVSARRADLDARWGDSIVYDLAAPELLVDVVPGLDHELRTGDAMGRLLATLHASEIPVVALMMPLAVASPHPTDLLIDTWLAGLHDGGLATVDLRPILGSYPYEVLANPPVDAIREGAGLYDLVHYNEQALAMAMDAALAVAAVAHGLPVSDALRRGVLPQLDYRRRGHRLVCEPQAVGRDGHDWWTSTAPCEVEDLP